MRAHLDIRNSDWERREIPQDKINFGLFVGNFPRGKSGIVYQVYLETFSSCHSIGESERLSLFQNIRVRIGLDSPCKLSFFPSLTVFYSINVASLDIRTGARFIYGGQAIPNFPRTSIKIYDTSVRTEFVFRVSIPS